MDLAELKERQSWSLNQKIDHSLGVIEQYVNHLGIDNVYVSFSGGKDSTVLLDLCRVLYPDIKAVFCNTGNEYPDIVYFVRDKIRNGENIEIIHPELKPRDVMAKVGFPLISKDVSNQIHLCRNSPDSKRAKVLRREIDEDSKYIHRIPNKYMYLLVEQYNTSDRCCKELKKKPFGKYERKHKVHPILGVMADESLMRQKMYIRQGQCNAFGDGNGGGRIVSLPLSIWTERDIWNYIKLKDLKIADIYHKGAGRTGCMFCGYGCQFKNDNRLQLVYDLYPKFYNMFMNYENNGVRYRDAMRKVLAVNHLRLPDEQDLILF